ncbi:hydantoinase B/oxoprolinase family protein [Hydrogenophaga sp.]|uniref:hydantoinase B/oxoprolinase family protein n=1 Tax=Hydrogenophaga sp. TaxID=1904254 RepID=UPI003F705E34
MKLDTLQLGLHWNRLVTVADEMTSILVRTAFSTVVNQSHDCACMLLDGHGNSIAQSSHALPAFMGTMPHTAKEMLRRFGATLKPGDVLATNDPWVAGGHLPDLTVLRPVFIGGELVAITASTAHLPDIGGKVWSADCNEVFEEGMRIPPMKLFDAGVRNETLFHLMRSNVRNPDDVEHDFMAQVTATAFGERRLQELFTRHPELDLGALAGEILARSEAAMRLAIARLPAGIYRHEVELDGFDEPLLIKCSVTVEGDRLAIDFSGSSAQQPFGINSVLQYTQAYANYALKCLLSPDSPCNEGSFRPLQVSAPRGSVLHASPPAAVGGRHLTGMFVPFAIYGALAQASEPLAVGDSGLPGSPNFTLQQFGADGASRTLSQFYSSNGGMGARWGQDGISTCSFPTNIANVPAEVVEARSGLVVECKMLTPDSGGAGRWRGGLGQTYAIRVPADYQGNVWVSMLSDRTGHPAMGRLGGQPGSLRTNTLNGTTRLHPKKRVQLAPGDLLETCMPGGAGVGHPSGRNRAAVMDDLHNGYISPRAAVEQYGLSPAEAGWVP